MEILHLSGIVDCRRHLSWKWSRVPSRVLWCFGGVHCICNLTHWISFSWTVLLRLQCRSHCIERFLDFHLPIRKLSWVGFPWPVALLGNEFPRLPYRFLCELSVVLPVRLWMGRFLQFVFIWFLPRWYTRSPFLHFLEAPCNLFFSRKSTVCSAVIVNSCSYRMPIVWLSLHSNSQHCTMVWISFGCFVLAWLCCGLRILLSISASFKCFPCMSCNRFEVSASTSSIFPQSISCFFVYVRHCIFEHSMVFFRWRSCIHASLLRCCVPSVLRDAFVSNFRRSHHWYLCYYARNMFPLVGRWVMWSLLSGGIKKRE